MSAVEAQIMQYVSGMSEVHQKTLLEIVSSFAKAIATEKGISSGIHPATKRMLGVGKDLKFIADGHSLDEFNDEIAEMFGVEN